MSTISLSAPFLIQQAEQLSAKGQFNACVTLCNDGLKNNPDSVVLRFLRAQAYQQLHDYGAALKDLDYLYQHNTNHSPDWHYLQVITESCMNGPEAATRVLEKAIVTYPSPPGQLLTLRWRLLAECGKYAVALQEMEASAPAGQSMTAPELHTYGLICRKLGHPERAIPLIKLALQQADLTSGIQKSLWFELARLQDQLGDYPASFDAASRGNRLDPSRQNATDQQRANLQVIAKWSPGAYRAIPGSDHDGSNCLFIVGMPRSGSTLTEQILQSNRNVHGLGEVEWFQQAMLFADPLTLQSTYTTDKPERLTKDALNRIARSYLDRLPGKETGEPNWFVDKNLANHRLIGCIAKALPGAKIIWCRRHPLDTILSSYLQSFGQLTGFNSLSNITTYWHQCQRLMQHWTEKLGIEVLPFDYEALVEQPEKNARRLLEFAGLPWNEECLAFHQSRRITDTASRHQVNQPLYSSSSGRWRNYEEQLAPVIAQLHGLGYAIER